LEGISCRLLPFAVADGPENMAADEALLHSAIDGTPSLRLYAWSPPTLSLGYFQPEAVRRSDPLLTALPFVRRPSGGDTLVHDQELTYALALPPRLPRQSRDLSWPARMHEILASALRVFGVGVELFSGRPRGDVSAPASPRVRPLNESYLCFHHLTAGDLMLNDAKIAGSAQRKHRGALLQHGAILLRRSDSTPNLPGIQELTGRELRVQELADAIRREFIRQTGWTLAANDWTETEREHTRNLVAVKYRSDAWNLKH
jgi:lipoate-protein ligase A